MTEKLKKKLLNLSGVRFHKTCFWCVHGDPDNLESLKDEKLKGNHHKATEKYIEILLETIDKAPQELGYEFGRWSAKRLATYLEEVTGIKLSSSQVWRIISKKSTFTCGQNIVYITNKTPIKADGVTTPSELRAGEALTNL